MKSRAMRVFVGSLLSFSSVFVLGERDLRAQSGYGSVAGTVHDASGAAIAEVSLRIINLQDNTVQSTVSGAAG